MSFDPGQSANPFAAPKGEFEDAAPPRRHSGFGIASFIISIVGGLAAFALIAAAGYMEASSPDGIDEESPVVVLLGLAMIGDIGLHVLGVALGLAGLVHPCRSKIFSVLGLSFNAVVILGFCGIMALGLAMVTP
jgi:hypothetical protein